MTTVYVIRTYRRSIRHVCLADYCEVLQELISALELPHTVLSCVAINATQNTNTPSQHYVRRSHYCSGQPAKMEKGSSRTHNTTKSYGLHDSVSMRHLTSDDNNLWHHV